MCGIKNLKGALIGGWNVANMDSRVSLDGAEGITSVGVTGGSSLSLGSNRLLTNAIALASNTNYPAYTYTLH